MSTFYLVAGAILLLGLLFVLGRAFMRLFLEFTGARVITCPENQCPAGVRVDAMHAGFSGLQGNLDLRLKSCSRWPERQDCGQECLRQIEAAPKDCLVRNILTKWYAGKTCSVCGKPIGEIHWADNKPALMNPQHSTVQWQEVPPESVPEVLMSHKPVCWNCHIVNRVMIQHPELIVDRSRPVVQ
jgi:hypothetical protein